MFKTTGPIQSFKFACKSKTGFWYETKVDGCSREHAKQILIGKEAPIRVCFPKE